MVARQMHLIGRPSPGDQQFGQGRLQAESRDMAAFRVRGQVEQSSCLVVGQQQLPVATDDQHALPHRVQYRVVVLVHTRDLGRAEAAGLAQQPSTEHRRSARGDGHRAGRSAHHGCQLRCDHGADVLNRNPGSDRTDYRPSRSFDGDIGPDLRAERANTFLPYGLAYQQRSHVRRGVAAGATRTGGKGVVGSVPVQNAQEVHAGALPGLLDPRLQDCGGVG